MSRIAIQLLKLATCVTALVVVPVVTPAKAAMSSSRHLKKHKKQRGAWLHRSLACRSGVAW